MEMITLTINGQTVQAPKNATILEAARSAGIHIPTLCYHSELAPEGACRLCVVEATGARTLVASCVYPVAEGMVVKTNTDKVRAARRMVVELLLANHPKDCLACQKSGDCELQNIAADLGLRKIRFEGGARKAHTIDASNPCLVRDQEKCILCGRCIRVCRDVQGMSVYSFAERGFDTIVSTAFEQDLGKVECSYCGQCASVCPTGAIVEKDGAIAKTYYAEKAGIDPAKIVSVSVMPCTAKKAEAARPEMNASGYRDVDVVITTRELGRMIREAGLDFKHLPEDSYDSPLGTGTGAAVIFGTTGGVMEAALRTVADVLTGENLQTVDYNDVRGMEQTREAELTIAGNTVKIAVVHTLASARKILERIRAGEADYQFIEVMACPGGCIGGGGQPIPVNAEIRRARREGLFDCDSANELRKSHENPEIKELYDTWLGKPLGEKAHSLLHTHYHQQTR